MYLYEKHSSAEILNVCLLCLKIQKQIDSSILLVEYYYFYNFLEYLVTSNYNFLVLAVLA